MHTTPIYINGRFLAKKITGSERFAREIIEALDAQLALMPKRPSVTFLAPEGTPPMEGLSCIGFKHVGKRQGHAWEQVDLFLAARKGFLINFINSGPVLQPKQLTVVHDAAVYRNAANFSFVYRAFHQTLGYILSRRSRIATVSEFSKRELASIWHIPEERIQVIYNGHEHILRQKEEPEIVDKLGLRGKPFFFFVGSIVPNKNLERAIKAFKQLNRLDAAFVIVGATAEKVFGATKLDLPSNVIMPGRLTDGEIVALYKAATALVFPSLYEGFGIPPLEAMTLGCPIVASDIPTTQEVCADGALYGNPFDEADIAAKMKQMLDSEASQENSRAIGHTRYGLFSWTKSAEKLKKYVLDICEGIAQ